MIHLQEPNDGQQELIESNNDQEVLAQQTYSNIKTAGGGYRPLYCAGIIFFQNVLVPKLEQAILNFDSWKYDKVKNKFNYATISLPNMNDEWPIICDDGSVKKYIVADVYYAPRKHKGEFIDRDFEAWPKMNTQSPFRSAQQLMLQRGFYLVEESDPDMSRKIVLKLYNIIPSCHKKKLWHDHNKIHNIYSVPIKNVEPVKQALHPRTNQHNYKQNFVDNRGLKKLTKTEHHVFTDAEFPSLPSTNTVPLSSLVEASQNSAWLQGSYMLKVNNDLIGLATDQTNQTTDQPICIDLSENNDSN